MSFGVNWNTDVTELACVLSKSLAKLDELLRFDDQILSYDSFDFEIAGNANREPKISNAIPVAASSSSLMSFRLALAFVFQSTSEDVVVGGGIPSLSSNASSMYSSSD
ncbi:hypothetical protein U1Q18_029693 [Sarracenia purpurea var. burkii]